MRLSLKWFCPRYNVGVPVFVGLMFARPSLVSLPFFIAGTLKIDYDVLLFRGFIAHPPPEEAECYFFNHG